VVLPGSGAGASEEKLVGHRASRPRVIAGEAPVSSAQPRREDVGVG
jgi:hypothetical protein